MASEDVAMYVLQTMLQGSNTQTTRISKEGHAQNTEISSSDGSS